MVSFLIDCIGCVVLNRFYSILINQDLHSRAKAFRKEFKVQFTPLLNFNLHYFQEMGRTIGNMSWLDKSLIIVG